MAKDQKINENSTPEDLADSRDGRIKEWWKKKDTDSKTMTVLGFCCVGLVIIIVIAGLFSPEKSSDYTNIGLTNLTLDTGNTSHVDIGNETTEYVFHGYPEANATVVVNSDDLNITPHKVELDANNSFHYKVNIPKETSEAKITFRGYKEGKSESIHVVTIKRTPKAPEAQSTPTTQSTSTTSYKTISVGGLDCEVADYLAGGETKDGDGKSFYSSPGGTLTIEVYTDSNRYQEAINFAADEPGTKKVSNTIAGHSVFSYEATDYNSNSYITYFFEVNGKQICVIDDGTLIDNQLVESFYKLN